MGEVRHTDVGGGSPVLEISVSVLGALPWNSNGCTTVGDTRGEGVDMTSFMTTSKTFLVIATIHSDVFLVLTFQFGDAFLNCLHAGTRLPRFNGRNVGMTSRTIPITLERLGVKGNLDAEFLRNSFEEVTCHPEMITHLDSLTGTDLEFPLRGHDLSVDSADLDSAVQARLVVCLDDITGIDFACSDTAVVGPLWTGETALRPSIRTIEGIEEGVFLFETEPRIVFLVFLHQLGTFGAVVEFVGGSVRIVAFCENEDIVPTSERVRKHSDGFQVDIRVMPRSLA